MKTLTNRTLARAVGALISVCTLALPLPVGPVSPASAKSTCPNGTKAAHDSVLVHGKAWMGTVTTSIHVIGDWCTVGRKVAPGTTPQLVVNAFADVNIPTVDCSVRQESTEWSNSIYGLVGTAMMYFECTGGAGWFKTTYKNRTPLSLTLSPKGYFVYGNGAQLPSEVKVS